MRSRRPRKLTKADYFEFHRPLWQKGLPLFLLVVIWGVVASYGWLLSTHVERSGIAVLQTAAVELWRQGVSVQMAVWTAAVLSLPLVVALYFACEKLLITPEAVVRVLPFRSRQIMRWVEVEASTAPPPQGPMRIYASRRKSGRTLIRLLRERIRPAT